MGVETYSLVYEYYASLSPFNRGSVYSLDAHKSHYFSANNGLVPSYNYSDDEHAKAFYAKFGGNTGDDLQNIVNYYNAMTGVPAQVINALKNDAMSGVEISYGFGGGGFGMTPFGM